MSGSNSDVSSQGDSDNSFDEYMRGIGTAVAAAVRELRTNPPEKRKRQNDRFERVVKQVRRRRAPHELVWSSRSSYITPPTAPLPESDCSHHHTQWVV